MRVVALRLLLAPLLLWPAAPALGQRAVGTVEHVEKQVAPGSLAPESERNALFLAGADWQNPKRNPGQDRLWQVPQTAPSWLSHWQSSLAAPLQPTRGKISAGAHTLLQIQPIAIVMDFQASSVPQPAKATAWAETGCPAKDDRGLALPAGGGDAGVVDVHVQILGGLPTGEHTLGVDIWCYTPKRQMLLRFSRLVVETDPRGHATAASGLILQMPMPLRTFRPAAQSAWVELPWHPAELQRRFAAIYGWSRLGWLLQLERLSIADWQAERDLPAADQGFSPDSMPIRVAALRAVVWLSQAAVPKALLLQNAASDRVPLIKEGAWDSELDESTNLIWQGVGVYRAGRDSGGATAEVAHQAGFAVWRLTPSAATPVKIELPRLAREGVWDCQTVATTDASRIWRCHFTGPELPGAQPVPAIDLVLVAGKGLLAREAQGF